MLGLHTFARLQVLTSLNCRRLDLPNNPPSGWFHPGLAIPDAAEGRLDHQGKYVLKNWGAQKQESPQFPAEQRQSIRRRVPNAGRGHEHCVRLYEPLRATKVHLTNGGGQTLENWLKCSLGSFMYGPQGSNTTSNENHKAARITKLFETV